MTRPNAAREGAGVPAAHEGHDSPDVRSAVVTGVTTALWYAVPDVVGPRWGRALAKTAVLGAGVGIGIAVTFEGRAALAGLRAVEASDAELDEGLDHGPDDDPDGDIDDASAADEPAADRGDGPAPVNPLVAAGGIAAALGAVTALAVLGEKWAYRLGERRRAKGRRLPHTGVGLVVGVLAAGLTLLEPRAVGASAGGEPDAWAPGRR
ncbi:hypothetical protein [Isoptericola sp. BMS4]|uniref:hypothetical protein n=1 Tax=Isoptericola sp. BMS4 TaxID=2527875 RepID=UPI0014200F85|nr:hypothetical protein [Isoptericola sp. BMS4]